VNVIESVISGVRQGGIRLSFVSAPQFGTEAEFRGRDGVTIRVCLQEPRVIG